MYLKATLAAFGFEGKGQRHHLVPCVLALLSLEVDIPFDGASHSSYQVYTELQYPAISSTRRDRPP